MKIQVESSTVNWIWYDANSKTVQVEFKRGKEPTIYEYYNVPEEVWKEFKNSDSIGKAVSLVLKGYEYKKIA